MLLYLVVNDLLVEAREALSKVVEVVEPQTQSNNINDNRPNIAGSAVVGCDVQVEVEGKEITNANSSASVKAISASWCVVQNISLFALCLPVHSQNDCDFQYLLYVLKVDGCIFFWRSVHSHHSRCFDEVMKARPWSYLLLYVLTFFFHICSESTFFET